MGRSRGHARNIRPAIADMKKVERVEHSSIVALLLRSRITLLRKQLARNDVDLQTINGAGPDITSTDWTQAQASSKVRSSFATFSLSTPVAPQLYTAPC